MFPSTFDGNENFKHVFHKGYSFPWPLMGPGVFFKGNENTMRIIMNTYANPYTYADITNMPVQKWVHVVLNCVKGGLDIFINGNLASRISFTNTLPYQNFQDLILFSNINNTTSQFLITLHSLHFLSFLFVLLSLLLKLLTYPLNQPFLHLD